MTKRRNDQQGPQQPRGATNEAKSEITPRTNKRAAPSTAWAPGVSGNPGGRPKLTDAQREAREAKAMAQPAAVARLVRIIESATSEDKDAIAAAKVILDGMEPMKLEVKGELTHETKPAPRADQIRTLAVLVQSGALKLAAETAEPVEEKPEGA